MKYFTFRLLPLVAAALVSLDCGALEPAPDAAFPGALSLDIYGLSYHPDREGVHRKHLDNQFNPGLGLGYEFHNDDLGAAFVTAWFYEDSGRNWAKLAGPGYQFKLGESWRIGATLPVIQSRTYNHSRAFVAPIPLLSYDFGFVKLNAVYAPKFRQNEFAAFGFYLSVPIGR